MQTYTVHTFCLLASRSTKQIFLPSETWCDCPYRKSLVPSCLMMMHLCVAPLVQVVKKKANLKKMNLKHYFLLDG